MRIPGPDLHDDPRRPREEPADKSLDVFEGEAPRLLVRDLSEGSAADDPLSAFATEATQRFKFVEAERVERLERFERLERPKRPERLKLPFGVLGLAGVFAVAFVAASTALTFLGSRLASQPDIAEQTRLASRDTSAPLIAPRTEPAAPAPVAKVGRVETEQKAQKAPALSETRRVRGSEVLNRGAERTPPAPTKVVERPSRTPVVGSGPLRAADTSAPSAAELPTPTTGVAPVELTTRSPVTTPIVAAGPPAPAAAAAAPPPIAPAPAPTTRAAAPRAAVETVLGRYASAFSALDAGGAKAVWPSVNQRSLEKAFDSLEQQEFDLGTCDIMVLPPRALAQCDGTARYMPKVGNKKERTVARHWTFRLQQSGQDWSIESVDSR